MITYGSHRVLWKSIMIRTHLVRMGRKMFSEYVRFRLRLDKFINFNLLNGSEKEFEFDVS